MKTFIPSKHSRAQPGPLGPQQNLAEPRTAWWKSLGPSSTHGEWHSAEVGGTLQPCLDHGLLWPLGPTQCPPQCDRLFCFPPGCRTHLSTHRRASRLCSSPPGSVPHLLLMVEEPGRELPGLTGLQEWLSGRKAPVLFFHGTY